MLEVQNWGRASDILEKYLLSKESENPVDIFLKTKATIVKKTSTANSPK